MTCILCFAGNLFAQKGKQQITITGNVKFPDPTGRFKIYLGQMVGEGFKKVFKALDSTNLDQSNTFKFKVDTKRPDFYQLRVYYMDRIDVWADKDNLSINFRGIDTAKRKMKNPPYILIEGSEDNKIINQVNFANYRNYQNLIYLSWQQFNADKAKDSLWKAGANEQLGKLSDDLYERVRNIVSMYHDRPAVLYALKFLDWKKDGDLIRSTLDILISKYPWLTSAKAQKADLLTNMAQTKKIEAGNMAPNFSAPDINEKMISPADFKGKYLIIDFWASWCGPCREEIPNLKQLYEKYGKKGLEILSVSVDAKSPDWMKALKEEQMPWPQIHAQNSKQVMDLYLFNAIPFMVVIDKEGRIVEKNVRGAILNERLKNIFGF